MQMITTVQEMVSWSKATVGTVGLVPTMGFLHVGHQSLMLALRPKVDHLIVSIYVNPLQFGEGEDLDSYPRDLQADIAMAEEVGVDVIFAPDDFYPNGFCTSISVHGLTEGLCGINRPGHLEGVCSVVARLFGVTGCDTAIFGEKDYQQLAMLKRMTQDLGLQVNVVGGALVRDANGLALSSRNAYLSTTDRTRALSLSQALYAVAAAVDQGEHNVSKLLVLGRAVLDVDRIDYLEMVDPHTLQPIDQLQGTARLLVAARVGKSRLLDNIEVTLR